ncbi:hypothetical protein WICMUC_004348 [Wickerhamomyces mucosus]|uniref:UBX domain-containing protein n=1 Tax=Wickerhamomyces mucosus TaxID=1378264 RepID=A0A9P8PH63_9ASCO|nr:hypothetical protein WICMUC_004348 [Wickerhamomyces mucosus]
MFTLANTFITSVEDAVGTSVTSNKPLIVYISEKEGSDQWIEKLITESLLNLISNKAVGLKLNKETEQLQQFQQIFPNIIVPSLFCIKVANVLDVISGDIDKETFGDRLTKVIEENQPTIEQQQTTRTIESSLSAPSPVQTPQELTPPPAAHNLARSGITSNSSTSVSHIAVSEVSPFSTTDSSYIAKEETKEQAKAEVKLTLKEQIAETAAKKYKEEQIKKAKQTKEDRERIRRLLKADEEERKLNLLRKQEERERQRRLSNNEDIDMDDEHKIDEIIQENKTLRDNIHNRKLSNSFTTPEICSLAIRLLNGSSIRYDFKPTDTLNDVRNWIDQNRTDGDQPYCFHRTIPRITFGVTDEEKTLEKLELIPRSALILKPFSTYSDAFSQSGRSSNTRGLFARVFGGVSTWFSGSYAQTNDLHHIENTEPLRFRQFRDRENELDVISAEVPSVYASPAQSPQNAPTLNLSHPSSLNLNLNLNNEIPLRTNTPPIIERAGSAVSLQSTQLDSSRSQPRIRTLNDRALDDRNTYNGNQLDLEDDKKDN